jgi:RNA polymerase sigma-70 factor (ECF subfamily)
MREVNEAMKSLTDLQREVLNLRFAGGLSIKETAKAVNRNENSVKALQHSAVKKLRVLLQTNQLFSEQLA